MMRQGCGIKGDNQYIIHDVSAVLPCHHNDRCVLQAATLVFCTAMPLQRSIGGMLFPQMLHPCCSYTA